MADSHEIYGYTIVATLGYGARSSIYAVRDQKGQTFALKRVIKNSPSDQRFVDQTIREHEVASQLDDDRLRKSYHLYKYRKFFRLNEVLCIMELVDGISLEQQRPRDVMAVCRICREVARGLKTMHDGGFVHADMKPNNILFNQQKNQVKVIDFGQSCRIGEVKERIQGTPDYIAPEQVRREAITPATDVFNLGATMYWLLTEQHVPTMMPRGDAGIQLKTEERIQSPRELNEAVVPALSSLVVDCIHQEPPDRPQTMKAVLDRLEVSMNQIKRSQSEPADHQTSQPGR
jgi:serine/threonine-protein kinase